MQIEENPNLHRLKRDVEYLCAFSGTRIHEKSTRKVEEMALFFFLQQREGCPPPLPTPTNEGRGAPLPYQPRSNPCSPRDASGNFSGLLYSHIFHLFHQREGDTPPIPTPIQSIQPRDASANSSTHELTGFITQACAMSTQP